MHYTFYRITPSFNFTMNNRWYPYVQPKGHFFFLMPRKEDMYYWVRFLCETHHRTYVYVHTVKVEATGVKLRILTEHKGQDIEEVMIPVDKCQIRLHDKCQKVRLLDAINFIKEYERHELNSIGAEVYDMATLQALHKAKKAHRLQEDKKLLQTSFGKLVSKLNVFKFRKVDK